MYFISLNFFFYFVGNLVFTIFEKQLLIKNILLVVVFIGKFQGHKNKFNFKTTKEQKQSHQQKGSLIATKGIFENLNCFTC